MPTNPKPTRDPQRISPADPRPSDRRAAHFAAIAEIINHALGRDPVAGLTPCQRAFWQFFTEAEAEAIVFAATGTYDHERGWAATCEQTRQHYYERLLGIGKGTSVCLPCQQRRAAFSSGIPVFFAGSGKATRIPYPSEPGRI